MATDPKILTDATERSNAPGWTVKQDLHVWSRQIWGTLVFSSVYLAIIAMAEVLVVQYVLSLPLSPAPLVGGLVTFAIYANDRLIDTDTDVVSDPRRTAFVNRHRDLLYVLAAVAYGLGVAIAALGGPLAFGVTLFPGVAWIMYGIEWIPSPRLPFRRVKELLVVNSLLVAVAWSVPIVLVPLAFADGTLSPSALVVVVYFVLGTFVNAEIANTTDVASDKRNGVSTLPIALGIRRTTYVLYTITLMMGSVPVLAALAGYLSFTTGTILAVGPLVLIVVLSRLNAVDDDNHIVVAAECTRLPVAALLLASPVVV